MRAATVDTVSRVAARAQDERRASNVGTAATAAGHASQKRTDADLVHDVRVGDAAAFDELVATHMRRAFAVAYRLLRQQQDAEDVVQDAFMAALVSLDSFDAQRPFGPWLLRIVANRALNLRKARALRQVEPIPDETTSRDASPLESAERSELRGELARALATLPEQQRWIVELFEVDGFTGPEIAAMLEMAEGTVRWHLHQARQTLRVALGSFASRTP